VIGPNDLNDALANLGLMSERAVLVDRRGTSEAFALAVLVGMVAMTTGAVGIYVLLVDGNSEESVEINFTYQYFEDTDAVLITHAQGESVTAGTIRVEGPDNAVTWAEAANDPEDASVSVGDSIQLSGNNVYGSPILGGDAFQIYRVEAGNRTELSSWSAG